MANTTQGQLLDVDAAADYLGVTSRWVRRAIAERRLSHHKIGRHVRIHTVDLDAYLDRQRVPARTGRRS
jgi:excisionase family DNA binding protein